MNRNGRQQGHITVPRSKKPVLITGGAGFIGTNLAHRFLSAGQPVVLFDTLTTKCRNQSLNQSARSKRIHQLHGYARETKLARAV